MPKPTKTTLTQLAQAHYGPQSTCEYIRTGGKLGWYLHNGGQQTLIGKNIAKAFEYLQSLESSPEKAIESEETITKPEIIIAEPEAPKKIESEPLNDGPFTPDRLLTILFKKFPKAFTHNPEQIKPLLCYAHKHIHRALDQKYTKNEIKQALIPYMQTKEYCEAIIREEFRIDLEGNPHKKIIQKNKDDARARLADESPMRMTVKERKKYHRQKLPLPVLKELVTGKIDVMLKIKELPANSKTTRNNWEGFIIKATNASVKMTVRPKVWGKLQRANKDYLSWVANIRGKMGTIKKEGFELETPGIQIFDTSKKAET
jgi:sRNA-binding protein